MLLETISRYVIWGVLYITIQQSSGALVPLASRDTSSTPINPASNSSIPDDINTTELGNPSDPTWIAKLTNVTNGLPTSFGDDETLAVDGTASDRGQRLARLNMLFPGIFWDKAYPDSQSESCSFEQLNILEMATRVAVRLTHYSPPDTEDAAFQRYFVTDGRVSGRWSNGPNRGHYLNLISHYALSKNSWYPLTSPSDNLKQVGEFPAAGDKKGRMLQKWRIGYLCGKLDNVRDHCVDQLGPTKVNAYTVLSGTDGPSQFGTVVIFCPSFFALRFTDMVTAGPKKSPADLGDPALMTFEQTIMHEWMHCKNPIGMAQKGKSNITCQHTKIYPLIREIVIDIDAGDPQKAVYGSSRCHDRAWLNMGSSSPNPEIVLNADNYAWTWINREFARVWEWTDDGSSSIDASADNTTYTTADIWTNLTSPIDPPVNCAGNDMGIDCSYIGMAYDDYLLDQGTACDCNGTICSSNSPACCASTTCSNCADIKANATDPADVPSCCGTNTCLWDLGSNVNGPIS